MIVDQSNRVVIPLWLFYGLSTKQSLQQKSVCFEAVVS